MDSETIDLDSARKSAGREILDLVDRIGFSTQAAGWVYAVDPETAAGGWRYYLITPMLDEKGPRWVYERLLKAFSKIGLSAGIAALDVHVGSPKDRLYRAVSKMFAIEEFQKYITEVRIDDGAILTRAYFYRLHKEPVAAKPRLFDRKVQQLLAA